MTAMHQTAAMNATDPRLSIRNLDFFYGTSKALKAINLEIPAGRVTAMIGPSSHKI